MRAPHMQVTFKMDPNYIMRKQDLSELMRAMIVDWLIDVQVCSIRAGYLRRMALSCGTSMLSLFVPSPMLPFVLPSSALWWCAGLRPFLDSSAKRHPLLTRRSLSAIFHTPHADRVPALQRHVLHGHQPPGPVLPI